jgi:hypothetical protein
MVEENIIRVRHCGGPGTKQSPEILRIPRKNLEQITSEEDVFGVTLLLEAMGFAHAKIVALGPTAKFTIRTIDGQERSGVLVRDHGDGFDLEAGDAVTTIARGDVVALARSVEDGTPFPPSSKAGRLRLSAADGCEYSGRPITQESDLPAAFRLLTDDGETFFVMRCHVLSMTRMLQKPEREKIADL